MDLDQLHTFLEIVRLKSFSKAAQTCYRTQPAISAQVRQLEQELNTTLFERFGTKISLTVAGRILPNTPSRFWLFADVLRMPSTNWRRSPAVSWSSPPTKLPVFMCFPVFSPSSRNASPTFSF